MGILKVFQGDSRDAHARDGLLRDVNAKCELAQDCKLGSCIPALHIKIGRALCVSELRGFCQDVVIRGSLDRHLGEHEVGGAIHDAHDAGDAVAHVVVLQGLDDRDAPADRRFVGEGACWHRLHRLLKLRQVGGDQSLVARHDVLALGNGCHDDVLRGRHATHKLHNHVNGVILEDALRVTDDLAARWNLEVPLLGHVADADLHDLQLGALLREVRPPCSEDLAHATTHRSTADQPDPHCRFQSCSC
mmetsp:Transcript_50420/g.81764  ORF Transcript_50420/g.81764 Transcript_50420/m.81764 type:complete len:247 (-) Transcript_50420:87-827(-)